MTTNDETVALCALNNIFGYHPTLGFKLMQEAGSACALFDHPPLSAEHPELIARLVPGQLDWARQELEKVHAGGFRFLSILDDDYPAPLRECPDAPLGLYLNGTSSPAEIFELRPLVAFVGTRDLSPYGRIWCQKLVKSLAEAQVQPTIVSGLALGADGVAHQTALECGLPTIGVMATGIETVYPCQHGKLAMDMVRSPGSGLVTDYPMRTAPVTLNFLRRNRIIAGLVSAVVVIESKTRGGSLMTARFAVDYSREVFAVPGRLDDLRSAGCNSLIHEQMAQIITSPEQLADALGLGGPRRHRGQGGSWRTAGSNSPEELLRALLVRKYGPSSPLVTVGLAVQAERGITAEQLAARLLRPYPDLLACLATLEADGILATDLLGRCSITAAWS